MRSILKRTLAIALVLLIGLGVLNAQQRKASDLARKKEKVERSYKKAYTKARKRTIKHRRDIQTAATRERMDAADKRAEAFNKQNDPDFIERYLTRKRPRKR